MQLREKIIGESLNEWPTKIVIHGNPFSEIYIIIYFYKLFPGPNCR